MDLIIISQFLHKHEDTTYERLSDQYIRVEYRTTDGVNYLVQDQYV